MSEQQLIPHLFRTEFSKITSVLTRLFGLSHISAAEDIASETFLSALETWPYKGVPENPVAWLYTVARNKATNYLNRNNIFHGKVVHNLDSQLSIELDIDSSSEKINDSVLQMMFTLSHPALSTEGQVALSLRILCGFGIDEIASAFLTNGKTIHKRIQRAKEKLRKENLKIEFPAAPELDKRLDTVLTTLYLLFSEGYYSENNEAVIRDELCWEAMRLVQMLLDNHRTNQVHVKALYALMCFQASRLPARKNAIGEIILYDKQDDSLWDQRLIAKGVGYLKSASNGSRLSKYHVEAGIAYWHTIKDDNKEKWVNILQLYNKLLDLEYSPMAALNRTYALYRANGKEEAIKEAEKLNLLDNHFYYVLLGEIYLGVNDLKAVECLRTALSLAKSETAKKIVLEKISVFS
jgi:RNA polymerase sigma-70 factor (ECF subfamily)